MSRQKNQKWKKPLGAIVMLALVAGGVAFALLQSQAKLTGNSIETDSANLLISQDDTTYTNAASGYRFAHVVPGSKPSQTEHFFLRNLGSTPLTLKIGVPSAPNNPSGVDLNKVSVVLSPYDMSNHAPQAPQSFSLQSVLNPDGGASINYPGGLAPGAIEEFDIQIAMDADAVSGSSAGLSNFDLVFTGIPATDSQ